MIAPLEKLIDWSAVQVMTLMMPANEYDWRLEESLRFLKGPGFVPTDSQPAQVEFSGPLHFRFPTPRPCNRAGFNVATLVPPYHFQRCPRERAEFDTGDCLFWAERAAQASAEIRALTGWLLGEGCPAVALWGYSLGAAFAGMTVCHDARLAAVVMAAPPARLRPCDYRLAVRPSIRRRWQSVRGLCESLNLTAMNLTTIRPSIPKENILLIEGIHDLLCSKDDIEDLWQAWGQPGIWRLPCGHVRICCGGVPGLPGRVLRWLAFRLDKLPSRNQMPQPNIGCSALT